MSRVIHSAEFEEERAWMKFVSKRSECYGKDKWNGKKWEKYFKHCISFLGHFHFSFNKNLNMVIFTVSKKLEWEVF